MSNTTQGFIGGSTPSTPTTSSSATIQGGPSAIQLQTGMMKETRINICSYEMYEMELLDRALMSLQKTEEAYTDINNRIIENVNGRKERLNNLNNRI